MRKLTQKEMDACQEIADTAYEMLKYHPDLSGCEKEGYEVKIWATPMNLIFVGHLEVIDDEQVTETDGDDQ